MTSKVHYRPIEAAIRWSGLQRHEERILSDIGNKHIPEPQDFPRWPTLRLNCERIIDAIVNGELRYSVDGSLLVSQRAISQSELGLITVRHIDLKSWMSAFYPDSKPSFLFSRSERDIQPAIAVRLHIEPSLHPPQITPAARTAFKGHPSTLRFQPALGNGDLGPRSEATYLHILGGLLSVMLGRSVSGKPNSTFRTQEAIINEMIAQHGDRLGITERTLEAKFAAAKRALHRE